APGGRLYIVELLRPDEGFAGGLLSLHLLVSTGGRERRREEFARLLTAAGLRLIEVRPTRGINAVLVAEVA
ncbi:MAG: methyltransferase, partial [Deltaproteobacteria bacterium]|nr:methyltransferase [Deltaproteobacteria bacterium]